MKRRIPILIIVFLFTIVALQVNVLGVDINSEAAVLMDFESGKVLYDKNMNSKMYPASLTKVLTAIVVVENCDINEVATVSQEAVNGVESGYVTANLKVGEQIKVIDLLNVLLIASSNDVANVLAEHVAGNQVNFVSLMNLKAQEIGCKNSNFVNVCGSQNENHYSSAYDLALIARYAMQNEIIKDIVNKTYYVLENTDIYTGAERVFSTTNEFIMSGSINYYKYAQGIKTGFTTPAGHCLVSYTDKSDIRIIAATLKATTSTDRYNDVKMLFDWGFENFDMLKIGNSGDIAHTINVKGATQKTRKLNLSLENGISILMKNEKANEKLTPVIELNVDIKAPICKGEVLGKITYNIDGIEYTTNLIASQDVEKSNLLIYTISLFILITIILLVIRIINQIRKNRKNKEDDI